MATEIDPEYFSFNKSEDASIIPNFRSEVINEITKRLGLSFVPEKELGGNVCFASSPEIRDDFKTTFTPVDVLDYSYAVLHSPTYSEKNAEFLKIDFPRVPYPKKVETFWQLVKSGGTIRRTYFLALPKVPAEIITAIDKKTAE